MFKMEEKDREMEGKMGQGRKRQMGRDRKGRGEKKVGEEGEKGE